MLTMKKTYGSGTSNSQSFFRAEVTDAFSEPVRIDNSGIDALVVVAPSSGTALVQYTISSPTHIHNDTAIWLDWDHGAVDVPTSGAISSGVTAVRVQAQGTSIMEILA